VLQLPVEGRQPWGVYAVVVGQQYLKGCSPYFFWLNCAVPNPNRATDRVAARDGRPTVLFHRWGGPPCPPGVHGGIGGTGFQPVRPALQDAGATKKLPELRPQASLNGVNLDQSLSPLARLTLLPWRPG